MKKLIETLEFDRFSKKRQVLVLKLTRVVVNDVVVAVFDVVISNTAQLIRIFFFFRTRFYCC